MEPWPPTKRYRLRSEARRELSIRELPLSETAHLVLRHCGPDALSRLACSSRRWSRLVAESMVRDAQLVSSQALHAVCLGTLPDDYVSLIAGLVAGQAQDYVDLGELVGPSLPSTGSVGRGSPGDGWTPERLERLWVVLLDLEAVRWPLRHSTRPKLHWPKLRAWQLEDDYDELHYAAREIGQLTQSLDPELQAATLVLAAGRAPTPSAHGVFLANVFGSFLDGYDFSLEAAVRAGQTMARAGRCGGALTALVDEIIQEEQSENLLLEHTRALLTAWLDSSGLGGWTKLEIDELRPAAMRWLGIFADGLLAARPLGLGGDPIESAALTAISDEVGLLAAGLPLTVADTASLLIKTQLKEASQPHESSWHVADAILSGWAQAGGLQLALRRSAVAVESSQLIKIELGSLRNAMELVHGYRPEPPRDSHAPKFSPLSVLSISRA